MLAEYLKEHNEQAAENKISIKLNYKQSSNQDGNEKLLDKVESDIKDINNKFGKENVNIKVSILWEEL